MLTGRGGWGRIGVGDVKCSVFERSEWSVMFEWNGKMLTRVAAISTRRWLVGLLIGCCVLLNGSDSGIRAEDPAPGATAPAATEEKTEPPMRQIVVQPRPAGAMVPGLMWDPKGVEDFSFTERSGKTITKQDLLGKKWIAGFIFAQCAGPCAKVSSQMKQIQERTEKLNLDVRLVSFSVDPKNDTPEVLTKYADNYGAYKERWLFLTGDQREIYGLIQRSFKMPVQEVVGEDRVPGFQIIHTTNLMLVDEQGVVQGKFNSTSDEDMLNLFRVLRGQKPLEFSPAPVPVAEVAAGGAEAGASLPPWVSMLPAVNASLNGLATLMLIAGYVLIKRGARKAHEVTMLAAFGVSSLFLATYLIYHAFAGSKRFPSEADQAIRYLYYGILISHVILAAAVPVLATMTIYRGLREQWESHKRLAKWTFPIWLYVSVTGVIIYVMLYQVNWV